MQDVLQCGGPTPESHFTEPAACDRYYSLTQRTTSFGDFYSILVYINDKCYTVAN